MAYEKIVKCKFCSKEHIEDSEEQYWHLKIHIAKKECDVLGCKCCGSTEPVHTCACSPEVFTEE